MIQVTSFNYIPLSWRLSFQHLHQFVFFFVFYYKLHYKHNWPRASFFSMENNHWNSFLCVFLRVRARVAVCCWCGVCGRTRASTRLDPHTRTSAVQRGDRQVAMSGCDRSQHPHHWLCCLRGKWDVFTAMSTPCTLNNPCLKRWCFPVQIFFNNDNGLEITIIARTQITFLYFNSCNVNTLNKHLAAPIIRVVVNFCDFRSRAMWCTFVLQTSQMRTVNPPKAST